MVITDASVETSELTDLLDRARQGDAPAFCALVAPLAARLFRQALALCGNPAAAEDLAAETMAEAWKSFRRYDRSCQLSTWLYAILLHRYQKSVCRARARPLSLAALPEADARQSLDAQANLPAPDRSPAETVGRAEDAARLQQLVEALPERHRAVIQLRFFADAPLADIAAVLRCSVGTVKSRLHYALEKLREPARALNLFEH